MECRSCPPITYFISLQSMALISTNATKLDFLFKTTFPPEAYFIDITNDLSDLFLIFYPDSNALHNN